MKESMTAHKEEKSGAKGKEKEREQREAGEVIWLSRQQLSLSPLSTPQVSIEWMQS